MNGIIARWIRNQELASEVKEELSAKRASAAASSELNIEPEGRNSKEDETPWFMDEDEGSTESDRIDVLVAAEAERINEYHSNELH